jgi:outer membrane protein assembly factor BamD
MDGIEEGAGWSVARGRGFIAFMRWGSQTLDGSNRRRRMLTRLFLLALVVPALAGCESLWGSKDDPLLDEPPDRIYNEGLYLLNEKRDIKTAAKRFEEVDRQHPYSEWARKALIMSAYAYYEGGAYEDSINAAQRYIQLHPGSPDAAYAQFLIGSSYFDQIRDITRDQDRTERAIAALDEVTRKYPNSEYSVAAKRKVDIARDQLAGKEMLVGRYYMERRDYTGAINRFKVVVTRYQTTRHVEEALLRLTEAYMALGVVGEAQTSAAVLGHNFPDSRWYKDAYALLNARGLEPSENTGSWISRAFKFS